MEDYRGVTLMPSLYKIYAAVLGERLRKKIEEKKILSKSQAGFRKSMGTMDQIYALNYLINRQLEKKMGKLTAVFIDLGAAFDSVNREKIIKAMRKRGVRKRLVERVEEIVRKTKNRVKVKERTGTEFWTGKGVRQGCLLSPTLFNILLADLEEEMERRCWGGIMIRGEKIYSLAYADDIVLLAEEEQDMRAMLSKLERYLEEKELSLNEDKDNEVQKSREKE